MQSIIDLFTQTEAVNITELGVDLILSAILSGLVYLIFLKFGNTISSRRQFGRIFFLVAVCTTLIIAVIKSSIALSLGLVGALSIVRFRTAVKEPEELAYLFLCIAIGLGFGAGLRIVTLFGILIILAFLVLRGLVFPKKLDNIYNLNVTGRLSIGEVVDLLKPFTNELILRRSDHSADTVNAMFAADFMSLSTLEKAIDVLKAKDGNIVISFVSNETLV